MPNQNLPKPNLPGQANKPWEPVSQGPLNQSSSTPTNPQTVFNQKPSQIRQAQIVPGGLSRENPGGTPPNMKVVAPPLTAEPASAVTSSNLSSSSQQTAAQSGTNVHSLPSRPMSPIDQFSLKSHTASNIDTKVQSPKPNLTLNSQNSARMGNANTSTQGTLANLNLPPKADIAMNATHNKTIDPNKPGAITQAPATEAQTAQTGKGSLNPLAKLKGKIPKPFLIGGVVLLVVLLAVVIFSLLNKSQTSTSKSSTKTASGSSAAAGTSNTGNAETITTLTYWGLWEDSQILKEVIADFEDANPSIKIDYRKQSHRDYRERLQQAIVSGSGPDIFRYHVSWVPMLSDNLAAMPSTIMSTAEYKQIFYPSAYKNLQVNGQIVGIPLMYEGLALFYNKEMLKTANIEVPTTWAELRTAASKLTVPANVSERQNNTITRAGLAIGNAGNVDHFSDILALLIIQNGGNPAEADSQYVKDALTFYTNFIKQDKVWSDRLANSTVAFAQGDVAMIFAPSWRVHDIKNLNPNLDFAVARVPQLDSQNPVAWASFWAEGVSSKSTNKEAAWTFLKYLSTPEVLRKFYNDASQYRAFGEIYPRQDMAAELKGNDLVAAFVEDAPIAQTWYMSSFTHDNGLNDQIIKYYEDAITATLSGGSNFSDSLKTLATGVSTTLTKYNAK